MDNKFMRLSDRQSELVSEKLGEVSVVAGVSIQLPQLANSPTEFVYETTMQMARDAIVSQLLTKFIGEDAALVGISCANGVYRFFVVTDDDHDRIVKEVMGA